MMALGNGDCVPSEFAGNISGELGKLLEELRRFLPFDFFCVFGSGLSGPRSKDGIEFYADNLPDVFRGSYLTARWFESGPADRAAGATVPLLRAREDRTANDLAGRTFEQLAEALGAVVAVVPVRWRGRPIGAVAIWRRGAEFNDTEIELLGLVAPALLLAGADHSEAQGHELSARERECLSWTSQGKTAWEIGSILGISEHTAVAHLNSAIRKLVATSRVHAVAEALRRGVID